MERRLPALQIPIDGQTIDPRALFASPPAEIWLEIGFGGGEHLAARARQRPDVGFLGCEPFVNGVAKLVAVIEADAIENIRIHPGDAGQVIDDLPAGVLDGVHLLYPDPWPKRRQRKRRFVSDEMLARLARIMRPGATLRFATDIDDYAGWTLSRVLRCDGLVWSPGSARDWLTPWPGWPGTRYEEKAFSEGRRPAYLTFTRT